MTGRKYCDIVSQNKKCAKKYVLERIKMYNILPAEIKHCERVEAFKRTLKEYIVTNVF